MHGLAVCSAIRANSLGKTLSSPCALSVLSEFSFWNTWYSVMSKSCSSMSWSESNGLGSGKFDWSSLVNTDAKYLLNSLAMSIGFSITEPSVECKVPSCDIVFDLLLTYAKKDFLSSFILSASFCSNCNLEFLTSAFTCFALLAFFQFIRSANRKI